MSDDSHGPHAVGLNYGLAADYLKTLGVSELWHLQASTTRNAGGRLIEAVKVEGDWKEDHFWRNLEAVQAGEFIRSRKASLGVSAVLCSSSGGPLILMPFSFNV